MITTLPADMSLRELHQMLNELIEIGAARAYMIDGELTYFAAEHLGNVPLRAIEASIERVVLEQQKAVLKQESPQL